MKDFLKKTLWINILTSIIFAVVGIMLIQRADIAMEIIAYVLGAIFIIAGLQRLYIYIKQRNKYGIYYMDFVCGVLAIIIGIVTILYSATIETIFRIVIDIWIIYGGLMRLAWAQKLRDIDKGSWVLASSLSVIMLIFGLYMLFIPNGIIIVIGVIMLVYALMDLIESLIFLKEIKNL